MGINRLRALFNSGNGHGHKEHPLDKWKELVIAKHPKLVERVIDEVDELDLDGLHLAAYVAAGRAMIYAGGQMVFDTTTGVIYGEDDPYKPGQVLHSLQPARGRCHEWLDHLFDQFKEECKQEQCKEEDEDDEDDLDEDDSELEEDEEDDSELEEDDEDEEDEDDSELDEEDDEKEE